MNIDIEKLLKALLDSRECPLEENGSFTEEINIEIVIENKSITESIQIQNLEDK